MGTSSQDEADQSDVELGGDTSPRSSRSGSGAGTPAPAADTGGSHVDAASSAAHDGEHRDSNERRLDTARATGQSHVPPEAAIEPASAWWSPTSVAAAVAATLSVESTATLIDVGFAKVTELSWGAVSTVGTGVAGLALGATGVAREIYYAPRRCLMATGQAFQAAGVAMATTGITLLAGSGTSAWGADQATAGNGGTPVGRAVSGGLTAVGGVSMIAGAFCSARARRPSPTAEAGYAPPPEQ